MGVTKKAFQLTVAHSTDSANGSKSTLRFTRLLFPTKRLKPMLKKTWMRTWKDMARKEKKTKKNLMKKRTLMVMKTTWPTSKTLKIWKMKVCRKNSEDSTD